MATTEIDGTRFHKSLTAFLLELMQEHPDASAIAGAMQTGRLGYRVIFDEAADVILVFGREGDGQRLLAAVGAVGPARHWPVEFTRYVSVHGRPSIGPAN